MRIQTDLPWSHRLLPYRNGRGDKQLLTVEGDIDNLDAMFTDLPDWHPEESHSTPESINKRIAGDRSNFHQATSYEEAKWCATAVGRDDVTKLITKRLATDQMREEVYMAGRRASRLTVAYGDEGDEIDQDRINAGEDDVAWRRMTRLEAVRRSRVIVLDVDIITSANTTQEQFVWNGVQTVVLADALESEGFRVEVNVLQVVRLDYNVAFCSRVRVKRAQDPLRIDLLAYQAGCVATTRAALWRLIHTHKQRIGDYGWCIYTGSEIREIAYAAGSEGRKPDHILPLALDEYAALKNIREVIRTYNTPATVIT